MKLSSPLTSQKGLGLADKFSLVQWVCKPLSGQSAYRLVDYPKTARAILGGGPGAYTQKCWKSVRRQYVTFHDAHTVPLRGPPWPVGNFAEPLVKQIERNGCNATGHDASRNILRSGTQTSTFRDPADQHQE